MECESIQNEDPCSAVVVEVLFEEQLRPYRKWKPLIWASAREVWKWKVLFSRMYLTKPLSLFGPINIASDAVRPNQAIIASFAVWLNQAIMSSQFETPTVTASEVDALESQFETPTVETPMVKSPEVDSLESGVVLEQPLAKAKDELVKVKLPDEVPATWSGLVDHVAACFVQLCDDFGGPCSTSTSATRTKLRVNSSAIGSPFSWCLRRSRVTGCWSPRLLHVVFLWGIHTWSTRPL